MALILHLSDLHLGRAENWQVLGDHKQGLVAPDARTTTQTVLKRTLTALHAEHKFNQLDAVLISGDITNGARRDGFAELESVLSILGDVPQERVLVVPGNHDVVWRTPPGSGERYVDFLRVTREKGLATPLLDGIDFGTGVDAASELAQFDAYPHVVETDEFVAVAINSSNWCGVVNPFRDEFSEEQWEAVLKPETRKEAFEELERLRVYDVPYVSDSQIEALRRFMQHKGLAERDGRLRIAVMHHHLLPVSTDVEVKAYESVVDLGSLRQFLSDLWFHIVLHGHKHHGAVYWDAGTLPSELAQNRACQVFVVAGPGRFAPGDPVCRVLEIGGLRAAHYMRLHTVLGTEAGQVRPLTGVDNVPIWEAEAGWRLERPRICGRTTNEVYGRIAAMCESGSFRSPVQNLYCEVENPEGARTIPIGYPDTGHADAQSWFAGLVDWWQRRQSKLLDFLPFNHGERLQGRYGFQLKRAARVLEAEEDTSRAIALLVDPKEEAGNGNIDYPAFVSAQFKLVREGLGRVRLDVIGYFRKQEMRYWWPINTAELASMQEILISELSKLGLEATPGKLATFSAIALAGDEVPGVAVAAIDRAIDHPARLWRMAAEVAFRGGDQEARQDWAQVSDELTPAPGQRLVLPRVGLDELVIQLKLFEEIAPDQLSLVRERVEQLAREVAVARDSSAPQQVKQEMLAPHVEALKAALDAAWGQGRLLPKEGES